MIHVTSQVSNPVILMDHEGWLKDRMTNNIKRFYRDEKKWHRYHLVFVDSGRSLPNHQPLLTRRDNYHYPDAINEWTRLKKEGWTQFKPQWGAEVM